MQRDSGKAAVEGTKALLDRASLPPGEEFGPGLAAFFRTSGRPENAAGVMYLFEFLTVAYRIHCVDGGAQISQPCVWSAGSTGSRDRLPLPGVPVRGVMTGRPMNEFSYHGDDRSASRITGVAPGIAWEAAG